MGNWWLASSSQQHAHSCIITSPIEFFFGETSNHPADSALLQPRFGTLRLLAYPKLISPLKGKKFQTVDEIQENVTGQLMEIGRTVGGSKVPTLKGTEVSLSYVQCFLYSISSSINVSFFIYIYYMAGYLLERPYYVLLWLTMGNWNCKANYCNHPNYQRVRWLTLFVCVFKKILHG